MSAEETGATSRRTFIKAGAVGTGVALAAGAGTAAASEPGAGTASWDNAFGGVVLNPGGVAYWWFDFGGRDVHIQIAGANILQPLNGARHTSFDVGKAIFASGYVQYYINVRNDGGAVTVHNLEGGGLT